MRSTLKMSFHFYLNVVFVFIISSAWFILTDLYSSVSYICSHDDETRKVLCKIQSSYDIGWGVIIGVVHAALFAVTFK